MFHSSARNSVVVLTNMLESIHSPMARGSLERWSWRFSNGIRFLASTLISDFEFSVGVVFAWLVFST